VLLSGKQRLQVRDQPSVLRRAEECKRKDKQKESRKKEWKQSEEGKIEKMEEGVGGLEEEYFKTRMKKSIATKLDATRSGDHQANEERREQEERGLRCGRAGGLGGAPCPSRRRRVRLTAIVARVGVAWLRGFTGAVGSSV